MMKKLLLLALLAIGMTANAETIIAGDGESEDESLLDLDREKTKTTAGQCTSIWASMCPRALLTV